MAGGKITLREAQAIDFLLAARLRGVAAAAGGFAGGDGLRPVPAEPPARRRQLP